jgi:hypothetical protein
MKERAHARSLYITGGTPPTRKLSSENSSMEHAGSGALNAVTAFLQEAGIGFREVAEGEWGLEVEGFEIGLRADGGLLRAQCWAARAGTVDPHRLLHWNRLHALARYAHSAAGEVHVHAEIPLAAAGAPGVLDRLLVSVVAARGRVAGAAAS